MENKIIPILLVAVIAISCITVAFATHNGGTIGSKDILPGAITSIDIKDKDIKAVDIAGGTVKFDIPIPIIFEKDTGSLDARSTGTVFTSQNITPALINYAKDVAIEATWSATHTDSATKIGVYDETANAYICSVEGNTGADEKSTYATLTEGHEIKIHVDVTRASEAANAKTTVSKAVMYIRVSIT